MIESFILSSIVIGFFVYVIFFMGGKEEAIERVLKKPDLGPEKPIVELKDEELFDPITGKIITLEEAESGNWEVASEDGLIPPKVIKDAYPASEHNQLHIKNYLIQQGYTRDVPDQDNILFNNELLVFNDCTVNCHWFFKNNSISYSHAQTIDSNRIIQNALLVDFPLPFDSGSYVVRKENKIEKWVKAVNETHKISKDGFTSFEFMPSKQLSLMQVILNELPTYDSLIIEFYGNHLVLIFEEVISIKDFVTLDTNFIQKFNS